MVQTNYRQIFARKEEYKKKLKAFDPSLDNKSGIYIFTRFENGFKYAYIGQAKHLLDRLISHLEGYNQHIDKSLKKHKLWSKNNPTGWQICFFHCEENELNKYEQEYIQRYANAGYQLRNKTSGSQDGDKFGIADNKESKGYRDGITRGKTTTLAEVRTFFDKYLDFAIKGTPNKIKVRKLQEFKELLYGKTETPN